MKKLISEMKEEVKVLAVVQRANKESHGENQRTGSYAKHLLNQDGTRKELANWWEPKDYSEYVTVLHIIYNRLRHRPPHLGSEESNEKYLSGSNPELWKVPAIYEKLSKKYAPKELEVMV